MAEDRESQLELHRRARRGHDDAAGLQQLLLDPELALRLHPDLLRDAARSASGDPGGQATHVVKAPVRARMVVPVQMVPGLIAALQENFRLYQESFGPPKGPVN